MEKIAILSCRKHISRCTMSSCITSLREGRNQFYGHAGAELSAVLDCGGCQDIYDSEAMAKKVQRLVNEGIFTVAFAGCVKPECPCWSRIVSDLVAEGIEILTTAHE